MTMLVGKQAPLFKAPAVVNGKEIVQNFSLEQYLGDKYVILFFYPKDFTYVCPTELIAFQEMLKEFESKDCAIVGCSTDTEDTHLAWLKTDQDKGGIKGITYPVVADTTKTISTNYGVLAGEYAMDEDGMLSASGPMIAYRGTFLIDKAGKVRHQLVNDIPLGRNIDEAMRMLDALKQLEEFGEVCLANWKPAK